MIQYISDLSNTNWSHGQESKDQIICYSDYRNPRSPDEFKVNIIDLSPFKWINGSINDTFDDLPGLSTLNKMIRNAKKTTFLIILGKDKAVLSDYNYYTQDYDKKTSLKYVLYEFITYPFHKLSGFKSCKLEFEENRTKISNKLLLSDFYFSDIGPHLSKTDSITGKITTIEASTQSTLCDIYCTTIDVMPDIYMFLDHIKIEYTEQGTNVPEWSANYNILDDARLKEAIKESQEIIADQETLIHKWKEKIEQNSKWKALLYESGDNLVKITFELLDIILDSNLANFKDKYSEDFLIEFEDLAFIGEIKGVSTNVKNEHLSQLRVHYDKYVDNLQENNQTIKDIKKILIINPYRNKDICERIEVHHDQRDYAKREEALIIETKTLLTLYEKFIAGEIDTNYCINLFKDEIGLLEL